MNHTNRTQIATTRTGRAVALPPLLTRTERQVLVRLAKGWSSAEVAEDLAVSKRTVDFHCTNIHAKLGVRNRVEAVNVARNQGLIPVELSAAPVAPGAAGAVGQNTNPAGRTKGFAVGARVQVEPPGRYKYQHGTVAGFVQCDAGIKLVKVQLDNGAVHCYPSELLYRTETEAA